MKHKKTIVIVCVASVLAIGVLWGILYRYNYIPHKKYSNVDFGLQAYISQTDADGDGIDDQTDILAGVKAYVATEPKYKSKYYATGYPNDEYGVCTDVVAFGLLAAGYDLQMLVDADIRANPDDYDVETPDSKIDFRRVRNLKVYFEHTEISLTTDTKDYAQWQGGDIVIFQGHIGVISDNRNRFGVPFVIHHGSPTQNAYEEDVLTLLGEIVGHYRISP